MSFHRVTRKFVARGLPNGLDAMPLNKVLTWLRANPDVELSIVSSNLKLLDKIGNNILIVLIPDGIL